MLHFWNCEKPSVFLFSAYASNLKSIILLHFKIFLRQAVKNINCQGSHCIHRFYRQTFAPCPSAHTEWHVL